MADIRTLSVFTTPDSYFFAESMLNVLYQNNVTLENINQANLNDISAFEREATQTMETMSGHALTDFNNLPHNKKATVVTASTKVPESIA